MENKPPTDDEANYLSILASAPPHLKEALKRRHRQFKKFLEGKPTDEEIVAEINRNSGGKKKPSK